jgi:hypothetical protein
MHIGVELGGRERGDKVCGEWKRMGKVVKEGGELIKGEDFREGN